jgi:hypothetical protein
MITHAKPRPRAGPENAPFWQGCRAHRLPLPTCRACGKPHLPGDKPIAIGQRVEVIFTDIDDDLTLHGFRIVE